MLFSIRPEYVERILDGSKGWEFRTRIPGIAEGELAYIYRSRSRQRIVASFRRGRVVASPQHGPADYVWSLVEERGGRQGVTRSALQDYLDGRPGIAMELLDIQKVDSPLPVGMRAPQAWSRLHWMPSALIASRWSKGACEMIAPFTVNAMAAHIGIHLSSKHTRTDTEYTTAYSWEAVQLIERELLSRGCTARRIER